MLPPLLKEKRLNGDSSASGAGRSLGITRAGVSQLSILWIYIKLQLEPHQCIPYCVLSLLPTVCWTCPRLSPPAIYDQKGERENILGTAAEEQAGPSDKVGWGSGRSLKGEPECIAWLVRDP